MPEKYGSVYTPDSLADFVAFLLAEEFCNTAPSTVLDPSSGELSLLRAVAQKPLFGESRLIGIDIDEEAVNNSRDIAKGEKIPIEIIQDDFISPRLAAGRSEDYWRNALPCVDCIISNPPWSSDRIYSQRLLTERDLALTKGQYDSFVLFVELSMKIISANGVAAFILPDSLFSQTCEALRRELASRYQIRVIARLGEKLFPDVHRATTVIVVKKAAPYASSETKCFRLTTDCRKAIISGTSTFAKAYKDAVHSVKQKRFSGNPSCGFDIDLRECEELLLEKIESCGSALASNFHFGRGVEISKSGMLALCPHCGTHQGFSAKQEKDGKKKCIHCATLFDFNPASIVRAISKKACDGSIPIYVGEDISRYEIRGNHYIKTGIQGVSYKSKSLYQSPKLLIRKTGLGLNAVLDLHGTAVTQTVYVCQPIREMSEKLLWCYLALLNSRVVFYDYLKRHGENEWKSHPYLTKDLLFSLPIIDVSLCNASLVDAIAEIAKQLQKSYDSELDKELEKLVFRLYGITSDEEKEIRKTLGELPDLSSINRMKY